MAARTKVLFVITKSNFGGAQRYVYDLATHLPRDQFEVAVACGPDASGNTGQLSYLLNEREIPTFEIPALTRDMNIVDDARALFALTGLLRAEKPDVVHVNSSKAGGLGALAARLAGIDRIVFTVHGLPSDEARSRLARYLIAGMTWLTAFFAHRTITISEDAFRRIRMLPFLYGKTVLIHNGIEPPAFLAPREARTELRAIDPSIPDGFLAGSIGELHANKGLDRAIEAAATSNVHLVIIGEGEERTHLEALAHEHGAGDLIHFLGFVPDAARYVRAFNAFVLLSRKEGLPYALLEAGAGYVPCIVSDLPTLRDIVLPDFTGIIATNTADAAAALTRLHDENLARSLAEEMATRIRTTFPLPQMVEKTIACYRR